MRTAGAWHVACLHERRYVRIYIARLHERRLRGVDQQVGGRCSPQPRGESFVAQAVHLHATQLDHPERHSG